jgi:16S rRNA (guanine(966)-N(2))-methyltransferase RsmD
MKEDLFNILSPKISGARFLDLYCGSGAIGIEALSRGAAYAAFADKSAEAINAVRANLNKSKLINNAEIFHMAANKTLEVLKDKKFDIIFMDPPYEGNELTLSLAIIAKEGLLSDSGVVIAESPAERDLPEFGGLRLYRQKKYKNIKFDFFERI